MNVSLSAVGPSGVWITPVHADAFGWEEGGAVGANGADAGAGEQCTPLQGHGSGGFGTGRSPGEMRDAMSRVGWAGR